MSLAPHPLSFAATVESRNAGFPQGERPRGSLHLLAGTNVVLQQYLLIADKGSE